MKRPTNIQKLETVTNENGKVVVIKNRKDNVVIMSMEEYKRMQNKDIEKHLLKAESDIKNGRVKDAREVFKKWKEQYEI